MASHTWKGRELKPLSKKLNPIWWFQNDDDPPPEGYNALTWFARNPMHNFMFYVVGVADRDYKVYGRAPSNVSVRKDIGEKGWQWSVSMPGGWLPLPWVSYTGNKVVWYLGWQPSGKLGAKFNLSS